MPDTIVIDRRNVYMSEHTLGVSGRLGTSVQPAIPNNPTDKAALERFFRSLRLSLLDKLPGYKGPNISSRGKDVEQGAFYYVTELEQDSSGNGSARSTTSSHTTGCATLGSPAWTYPRRRCSTAASPSRASCGFPPLRRTCATSSWTSRSGASSITTESTSTTAATTVQR